MKKPTFSKLLFSVFFLFENFFQKNFIKTSFCKDFRNLKSPVFEKKSFFRIEYTITVFILAFFLMSSNGAFAQIGAPFKPRLAGGNISVKGDIVLIGNSIVNRVTSLPTPNPKPANWDGNPAVFSPSAPVNNQLFTGTVTNINALTAEANVPFDQRLSGSVNNNSFFIEYSNVDPGTAADGIFSSSSADLNIKQTCKKIKFAGLYWSAIYPTDRSTSAGVKYNGSLRSEAFDKIKIKLPGVASSYQDITADQIIFTSKIIPAVPSTGDNTATFFESPYVCFKDVTTLLNGVKDASGALDANGKYTVANVRATRGMKNGGGAGGWTLVVIYETPTMPSKFISIFDGYASVSGTSTLDIPVSGFKTLPLGYTVNAKLGVAALEGDVGINNDSFQFRNGAPPATYIANDPTFTKMYDAVNPADNFFNATISEDGAILTNRNPASLNSMGFDIDNFKMPNDKNSVLPNGATQGTLRLTTTGDGYGAFLTTFAVDVIEPNIVLTKKVVNTGGDDITNTIVGRGDVLRYVIGFNNLGSDKAQNVIIEDYLPNIVFFNYPADVLSLPTGVTVQSYNPAVVDPHDGIVKRKIVFSVDNSLVDLVNDQEQFITFQVKVPTDCKDFSDACSNIVNNTAYTIYNGDQNFDNNGVPFGSGSQPPTSKCALGDIATNFIGNIDDCLFDSAYTLCGNSVSISGRNGFQNYTWTGPNGFTASGQTITVTKVGDYFVKADPIAPCIKSLNQNIKVTLFSAADNDALLKYAFNNLPTIEDPYLNRGEIVDCKINGVKMPHIFLCGANDYRDMTITNAAVLSAAWYQLAGASCIASAGSNGGVCANEDLSCSWDLKSNSLNYKADTAGYFKVILKYDKGCSNTLYFNVYKNDLKATESHTNIICTSKGKMIVGGFPPTGYEYSFNLTSYTGVKTYSSLPNANIFTTSIPENYTASIRQIGITNGCVFTVSAQIDLVDFKVNSEVTQPTCSNVNGSIKVTSTSGSSNYIYTLTKVGFGVIDTYGPFPDTNHTFSNQSPGTYSVNVKTADGCNVTVNNIVINSVLKLTATASLTKPLTCVDGEFTIYPVGGTPLTGTPPYYYYKINGAASVINPVIPVTLPLPSGGLYNIEVIDKNNCSATTSITVSTNPKPVYTVVPTNILCYGTNTGAINFNVTSNTSGYTLAYSIDGGTTYSNNPLFSSLVANTVYSPKFKYSLNGVDCIDTLPTITLTGPSEKLTASAGVSELSGCGLAPNTLDGKIRITNPQGGVPPYQYNFNNPATASDWSTVNDAYKPVGTYTVYIRDKNLCVFPMANVTIDPLPVAPRIDTDPVVVFNCDGTATSTVTVNNPPNVNYDYTYSLDGTLNTPSNSNVFNGVKSGDHIIKVGYALKSVTTFSNLLNENFGYGDDTTSPGINTAFYCFERQVVATQCRGSNAINDGDYSVTSSIVNPFGAWVQPGDHTPQTVPPTPKGRSLVVNIGDQIAASDVLYQKVINDIIPNQPINFELFAMNLLKTGNTQVNADLRVALVDASGTEISWFATGEIPKTQKWESYPKTPITLNPGPNTSLKFIIRSNKRATDGNDVAIDDIKVYQLPKACALYKDINFTIASNKKFTAQVNTSSNTKCAGSTDGTIEISAQNFDPIAGFEYSKDGITWLKSTTSPVTLTNLAAGSYTPQVRYNTGGACQIPLTLTKIIAPQPIVVKTTQTLATCLPNGGATVDATGTAGGTGAYTIQLVNTVSPFAVTNFPNTLILNNVAPGTYTVVVRDVNSCKPTTDPTITIAPTATPTATIDSSSSLCFDPTTGANIVVKVTGGVGPYTYKSILNGGTPSASSATFTGPLFTFNATVTGTYSFEVTDSFGCKANTANQIINAKLTANTAVFPGLDCDVAPADQAVITGTISGGKAPFTVTLLSGNSTGTLVQPTASGNTFAYSIAVAGTYNFQIKDANNCLTTKDAVINAKTPVTGDAVVTNETCETLNNGSVTLQALTGVAPFTYSFNGILPFTNTVTYGSLAGSVAGTSYPYQIKDNKGCIFSGTAIVKEPTPIALTAGITPAYTCDQPATITASATDGNGGFTYVLKRTILAVETTVATNTTGIFPNLSVAGSYTVTATDAKGCSLTSAAMAIDALNPPKAMTISNSLLTCPTNKANVSITDVKDASGTLLVGPFTYAITAPAAATSNVSGAANGIFTNLDPSITYTFEVKDAKNCTYSKPYTITPLPVFTVSLKSSVNETCLNAADGSAIFTVSGLATGEGYSYKIDLGSTTSATSTGTSFDIPTTGLSVGSHTITVTNTTTECFVTANVTIGGAPTVLQLNAPTLTHVTCLKKGTATINAVGGWGTYTYTVTPKLPLVGPAIIQVTNNKFIGLEAGTYSVSVKDLSGCTLAGSDFTINDKVLPSASIDATSNYCAGGAGATLVVTPTVSPQPNYRYSINGSTPQISGTFSGLTPGGYDIVVSDIITGCTLSLAKQTINLPVTASTKLLKDLDCDATNPEASIEVTIADGYPDYKYRANTTGAPFTGPYTPVGLGLKVFTYPPATAGIYYFEITDNNGCTTVVSRTINALVKPDFSTTQVNVKCKTEATGSITVSGIPASGTYTYSNDNGATFQASNVFATLLAGPYQIVVKDAKKCPSLAKTVTITEPSVGLTAAAGVTTKLSCGVSNASQAATITVTAQDGTPYSGVNKYRYSYNGILPAVTSNTYTTNTPGAVTVVVYDANGCSYTIPVADKPVVDALNPPTALSFLPANSITCDPLLLDTDLTVTVTDGVTPFTFEITSTDAAVAPTAPVATGILTQAHTFANLLPGTYFFKVTDANKCTKTGQFTIDPVVTIQASGAVATNVTCNGAAGGVLKFTVSGNTAAAYTYTLVGSVTGIITGTAPVLDVITYSGVKGGETYTFTVTNTTTKCTATAVVPLSQPAAITALAATASKVFCAPNVKSTIKVTATGGTAPLQFAVVISGNTPFATDYNTTGVFVKDTSVDLLLYDAYVIDKNGNCSQHIPVSVVQDAAPTVDTPAAQCYSGTPFTITMTGTVFGGSSIKYGINGVYTTNAVKTISAAGSYNLTVKDDNGCISPVVIYDVKDQLTITTKFDKDLTCTTIPPTPTDAQVTLTAGGGNGTYVYEYRLAPSLVYIPLPALPGNVYNPTLPGDYYFSVTSGGCTKETTVPVKVSIPTPPTANTNIINLSCYQSADGVVTLIPTAGATPFTYSFNGSLFSGTATYSNLAASTGLGYPYIVRDAKGCEISGYAIVNEPNQILFTVSSTDMMCPGPSMGSVTVSAITNGVAPFVYTLRNIVTGAIFTHNDLTGATYTFPNLSYGDFEVTVSDSKSCSKVEKNIKVLVPPSNLVIDLTTPIATCADGATIIVTVNPVVIPAVPAYQYGIYDMAVAPFSSALLPPDLGFPFRHTFANLTPGVVYTFVIYDPDTNCYYFQKASGPVAPITSLTSTAPTAIPVTCNGSNNGSVNITIDNYDATTVNYEIFYAQSATSTLITGSVGTAPQTFTSPTGLKPGTYYIKFIEVGGTHDQCTSSSATFSITESAVILTLTASSRKNDNCKSNAGEVAAIPSGGTGPFLYQIVTDNGAIGFGPGDMQPTSASFVSPTHLPSTFNVDSGNYIVWVKDANGCIKDATVTVVLDPVPVFALTVPNKCAAEGSFAVDVVVTDPIPSMAPYAVSVNGGTFENFTGLTYSATGLNSGLNQSITIQDKNGCPITKTFDINATPLATAVVSKVLDCSVSPTAVENATITVTITKGTTPYTYQVKKGLGVYAPITPIVTVVAGVTTFDYTVASIDADTYQFRITDSNTCAIETNPVIIDPIIAIVAAFTPTQPLCNGDKGTIELAATVGQGAYTYSFNGSGFTSTTVYSVIAGTYPYIIKDALGCEVTGSAVLGEPSVVTVGTPIITPLSCGPGNVGQAAIVDLSAVAFGGSGAFKYSFNGSAFSGQTTYTVNDTGADQLVIPYAVQDANGCTASGTVDIFKLNPPTNFVITQARPITCTDLNSNVTLSNVVNTVGPILTGLTYQIISSTGSPIIYNGNNPIFTNLLPGSYVFQVKDANGCVKQLPYEIKDVIKINIVEQSTTGITCFTATDGKASFLVSGFGTGVGTYHYVVDGVPVAGIFSSPNIDLINLVKGSHTIEVFDDATNCSKLISFTIDSPTAVLALDPLNVTPLGCTTFGAVTIVAKGGWGPYEYTVTPPFGPVLTNNKGLFAGLTQAGLYTIVVKDANGCPITDAFTLTLPVNPIAAIDVTSDYCYDGTNAATLVVKASLGVAPYLFSIDNGLTFVPSNTLPVPDDTYTFSNLSPSSYDVVVKDAFGCKSLVPVNTVIKSQLFATAQKTKEIFCGSVAGTIKIDAVGGYGPYTYTVKKDGVGVFAPIAFPAGLDTVNYSVTGPGSYAFVVYDAKGCSFNVVDAIVMVDPTPVTYTATPTAPSCTGAQGNVANGSIDVVLGASNDNPDYKFEITRTAPTAVTFVPQDTGLFTGLIAGTYDILVTSARGCFKPDTVTIADPNPVVASATASAFTCSATNTINQTTVTVKGTGGAGTGAIADYRYSDDGINWKTTNTFNVNNVLPQNPTYYVKDANGCIDDVLIPIAAFPKLVSVVASFGPAIDCLNNQQEMNVVIAGGSNAPLAFTYQAYQDGIAIGGLTTVAGNSFTYNAPSAGHYYEFKVFDNNTTCSLTSVVYDVPLFNTINVVASTAANAKCNTDTNGAIEINVTGYSGTYDYEILRGGVPLVPALTGSGDSSITSSLVLPHGLGAGTDYTVLVKETSPYPKCTTISNVVIITEPAALDLTNLIVNVKNQNCNTAGAVLTVDDTTIAGGTPDYTYAFVFNGTGVEPIAAAFKPIKTTTFATTQIAPLFDTIEVWVKDTNGCTDMKTVTISQDPMPTVTATVDSQCANPAGYTISAVGTGVGTLEYSLDGNSFKTATSFNVSTPGSYTVTVRDANQCLATSVLSAIILKPLGLQGVVSNPRSCKALPDGEITLTAFDGSGVPNYEYSKDGTTYVSSNVFSNLEVGTYTMYVRDIGTALPYCVQSVEVVIDVPTLVTGMALTTTAVSCQGSSDGSITVALAPSTLTVNNNPDYNYSLSGTTLNPLPLGVVVNKPNQLSNIFDNLQAGTYTITTTSSRGCQDSKTITVVEPAAIVVPAPVVVDYACSVATPSNTMNLATITINPPAGGSGTYPIYEFVKGVTVVQSDLSNVYTQTDLSGGTFTINVYDTKGCVGTTTATINPFVSIDFAAIAINVTKDITCVNDEDIQVNVTTTGTTVPMPVLKYDIIGLSTGSTYGDTNFTGAFTGLTVGDYMVTVTNPDTGCAIQKIHYVNEPNTFDLNVVNKSDVVCYGSNEGSVEFNFIDRSPLPEDESGPYSYIIKDASGTRVQDGTSTNAVPKLITGLIAGTYSITATLTSLTSPQCTTALRSFTINQPTQDLVISETHTAITCANNDGSISVSAVGGWPGDYVFQLEETTLGVISSWSATTDFNGLIAGNYVVKVRDTQTSLNSTFCERQVAIALVNPTPITATIIVDKSMLTCFGETNATITVNTVSGGSGVYNYALEATYPNGTVTLDGPQSSNVFTNLGAASYKAIVTDTWNCSTNTNTLVVVQPTVVSASLVQTSVQTCLSPATVTLSAVGGTGPYTYSADPNFATPFGPFASSTLITVPFTAVGINPLFYVRDVNGCSSTASNSVSVTPLEPLDFKFENDAPFINCFGDSNGQITAIAEGGSGNYIYTLLNNAGNPIVPAPTQPTPGFFTDLAAGTYLMEVRSGDCTSARKPITITEPSSKLSYTSKVTDVLCNGDGNGKLEIVANGGSPAIVYALSPELSKFVTTSSFTNLAVGDYKAIIQDLKGCNYVYDFKIKEPNAIQASALIVQQEKCFDDKTGAFDITIKDGVGPYSTSLDYPKGTFIPNQLQFAGLTGGDHTVYIKDSNACPYVLSVLLDKSVYLNPIASPDYMCINNAPANSITVTVDTSVNLADVKYYLDASTTENGSNLFPNLTPGKHEVYVQHENGCIAISNEVTIKAVQPLSISIELGELNQIVATVSGGSGVYQFKLNEEQFSSQTKFIYFKSGNYTVTVTDSNGCVAAATKYFEFIDIFIPPIFTPTGDGTYDTWKPTNTENYPDIKFIVYDRYGRVVGTFGAGQSWDGTYNGTELPMGDYWYVLKLRHNQDDREFMGHFTLYR
jgi:gliding motility-associated-like protein